jgi:hypothetical protein
MKPATFPGPLVLAILLSAAGPTFAQGQSDADDLPAQIGLADMPGYRAALSGKATADDASATDPPRAVSFRDLWDHADSWLGRRVTVHGRIARIFRQGAVGSFPPLVEAWISTPAGDLLCVVFPQGEASPGTGTPEPGQQVSFTGTFFKPIRYKAADQARLAPLIVGDRQPGPLPETSAHDLEAARASGLAADRTTGRPFDPWSHGSLSLGLLLGLAAAGVLLIQHLRGPRRAGSSVRSRERGNSVSTDPPLEFLDEDHDSGPTLPDSRSA